MEQIYTPKQDLKVLVRCFTYNQSKYIEDALNGFAMQQTNFPFVCLVMDDCSTDGEQEVIKAWMQRECDMEKSEVIEIPTSVVFIVPHKTNTSCSFAFYLLKQNLYKYNNIKADLVRPWRRLSNYEALCEGDDYWIDNTKLQKQVDYLDANPKCGLVYTKTNILDTDQEKITGTIGSAYFSKREIYTTNKIATLTVCFKTGCVLDYAKEVPYETRSQWLMGDYPLWLYISEKYDIQFIDKVTAVYRANRGSASRPDSIEKKLRFIGNTKEIQLYFASRTQKEGLERQIERNLMVSVVDTFKNYNRSWEGIKRVTVSRYLNVIEKIKYIIHLLVK